MRQQRIANQPNNSYSTANIQLFMETFPYACLVNFLPSCPDCWLISRLLPGLCPGELDKEKYMVGCSVEPETLIASFSNTTRSLKTNYLDIEFNCIYINDFIQSDRFSFFVALYLVSMQRITPGNYFPFMQPK